VNTKRGLGKHPDENLFEDYFFDGLSEQAMAIFEGHLLKCPECQATLAATEDYIGLMKGASMAYAACRSGSQHNSLAPLKPGDPDDSRLQIKGLP
jgi:hypothetical protein